MGSPGREITSEHLVFVMLQIIDCSLGVAEQGSDSLGSQVILDGADICQASPLYELRQERCIY